MHDPVNPAHYKGDTVMRVIEDFDLGFRLGNVIKYILRAKAKAGPEDIRKSRWYLNREIWMQGAPDPRLAAILDRCTAKDADAFEQQVLAYLKSTGEVPADA